MAALTNHYELYLVSGREVLENKSIILISYGDFGSISEAESKFRKDAIYDTEGWDWVERGISNKKYKISAKRLNSKDGYRLIEVRVIDKHDNSTVLRQIYGIPHLNTKV